MRKMVMPEEARAEALDTLLNFVPFSHWPAAYHHLVMEALLSARAAGVNAPIYIKEKLGSLRIQGREVAKIARLDDILRKANRTCAVCGNDAALRVGLKPPKCAGCEEVAIDWVEI